MSQKFEKSAMVAYAGVEKESILTMLTVELDSLGSMVLRFLDMDEAETREHTAVVAEQIGDIALLISAAHQSINKNNLEFIRVSAPLITEAEWVDEKAKIFRRTLADEVSKAQETGGWEQIDFWLQETWYFIEMISVVTTGQKFQEIIEETAEKI